MDPAHKGQTHNSTSLEGSGLSVSVHPYEWTSIAKLGGCPTWELANHHGAQLIDVHALNQDHWGEVRRWAVEQGLLQSTELLIVSWHDDELDDIVSMVFDANKPTGVKNAYAEFEDHEANGDASTAINRREGWRATELLSARTGFAIDISEAQNMALNAYVEDVLHPATATNPVQGLWWEDDLDVYSYSAPRGVIHAHSVNTWAATNIFQGERQTSMPQGPSAA